MKKKPFILYILLVIIIITPIISGCFDFVKTNSVVKKANELYQKGDYKAAIKEYTKIIDNDYKNDKVFFNLGNAYYKEGQKAKAIAGYKTSLKFNPRNSEAKSNLSYVKKELGLETNAKDTLKPFFHIAFFWFYKFNLAELFFITILFNVAFVGSLILYKENRKFILKVIALSAFIAFTLLLVSLGIKLYDNYTVTEAIVLKDKTPVMSGNGHNFIQLSAVNKGESVYIKDIKEKWLKIITPKNDKGWIHKSHLILLKERM